MNEVNLYSTDPLNADTDGDGISDGIEVAIGSSPTDINDGDITPYVTGLSLDQTDIMSVYAGINENIQLQVTAIIEVNAASYTLDVTDSQLGTLYSSLDIAIANPGLDGNFLVTSAGETTVTASLGSASASATLTVIESQIASQEIRLLPMIPQQRLYDSTDKATLWIELGTRVPVESIESIKFFGGILDYEVETNAVLPLSLEGEQTKLTPATSQIIRVDIKYGVSVPDIASLRDILPDPDAIITVDPSVPDSMVKEVGEALEIPLSIVDPGQNTQVIEYLLDGEPLSQTRPIVVQDFELGDFTLETIDSNSNEHRPIFMRYNANILNTLLIDRDVTLEMSCCGVSAYTFIDDGDLTADDFVGQYLPQPYEVFQQQLPTGTSPEYILVFTRNARIDVTTEALIEQILLGTVDGNGLSFFLRKARFIDF